jgi:predicted small lipoprotein YifL
MAQDARQRAKMSATEKPKGSRTIPQVCYVASHRGDRFVIRAVRSLPLIALAVVALALAGCGRKGPLDLPPSAAINQPPGTATAEAPALDAEGRPVAPPGSKKRLPIDPLLD